MRRWRGWRRCCRRRPRSSDLPARRGRSRSTWSKAGRAAISLRCKACARRCRRLRGPDRSAHRGDDRASRRRRSRRAPRSCSCSRVGPAYARCGRVSPLDHRADATIVAALRASHPHVPVIGFPRGAGLMYRAYVSETGVSALGLDSIVPCDVARGRCRRWGRCRAISIPWRCWSAAR